jgi:tetratricopeptide (TPR) repeat protein
MLMPVSDNPRIEELRQRLSRDPASIAFAHLAEEYRRAGEFEQAINVCRAGLDRHPTYVSARVTLGRALLELERYDEACVELEAVLRVAPDNLAAIRALADIHQKRPEFPELSLAAPAAHHHPVAEPAAAPCPNEVPAGVGAAEPLLDLADLTGAVPSMEVGATGEPISEAAGAAASAHALSELERWLSAIHADRARSHQ